MGHTKDLPTVVLRTFVTIVDRGGFTQAAQALGLTQPTVSLQLKKLEELIEKPLIDRSHRQLRLTTEGQALLDYARRILALNDEVISTLTQPAVSGTLRLGIPHEFTLSILPKLVGAFSQIHPNVVIEVECELSKKLLANLNDYDLVIALHKRESESSGGNAGVRIRREPLAWVSSPDYLFDPESELKIIAAPHPCIYRDTLQTALRDSPIEWALRLTSTSYSAVSAAVSTGMGVTVLAESVIPNGLRQLKVDALPALPPLDLRLHYDRTNAAPAARTFVSFVKDRLNDE